MTTPDKAHKPLGTNESDSTEIVIPANFHYSYQRTSPHFSPGFGILGQAGEAGWTIGRRSIAVAMGETDIGKGSENLFPVERVAQG